MIWTAENYRTYLLTEHWATTRDGALRVADFRCARCGAVRRRGVVLDVHHRTYERVGREQPGDLEVLCRVCHGAEHGIMPETPPPRGPWHWEHIGSILPRVLARMGFTAVSKAD